FTSTVYYREQRNGTIFAYNNQDNSVVELERSTEYARFVGMTLQQRTQRLYWSDSRTIKSANVDGSDTTIVIGTLVRVTWIGVNFGSLQSDLLELIVKGTRCVSILSWSSEKVECLVGLPQKYPSNPDVAAVFARDDDCWIRTTRGAMQGTAPNYGEMRAAGYESPIVERIKLRATFILPHALAVNDVHPSIRSNDQEPEDWLYWSNSADGTIYRSSLRTTKIDIVHEHAWSARGLALGAIANEQASSLYFSLESKGTISRISISASQSSPSPFGAPQVLLTGLESPRGLALDASNDALYFAEKTGRVYKAKLFDSHDTQASGMEADPTGDNKVGPMMAAHRILTVSSLARLDGITVDSKYLYWCETNSNIVARASLVSFEREVVVGGSANSQL
uniref:Uncharacterized protein n=1 Tax=Globisporangium ultimum (strain ATCC 200006 / CBS 805.95 / DAOM BR144) TaxID=431595 RepID=K3WDG8_GLOUD